MLFTLVWASKVRNWALDILGLTDLSIWQSITQLASVFPTHLANGCWLLVVGAILTIYGKWHPTQARDASILPLLRFKLRRSTNNRMGMIFTVFGKCYPSYYHHTVGCAQPLPHKVSGIPPIVCWFPSYRIDSSMVDDSWVVALAPH